MFSLFNKCTFSSFISLSFSHIINVLMKMKFIYKFSRVLIDLPFTIYINFIVKVSLNI